MDNGWQDDRVEVMADLAVIKAAVCTTQADVKEVTGIQVRIREDISALKVKAGLWGGAGGLLGIIGSILIAILR